MAVWCVGNAWWYICTSLRLSPVLPWLLLLYLLGKKVGKKAAGDKPISHYFHLKLFILCGDKNFFNRIVQKLDEITADQWWWNSTFHPIIHIICLSHKQVIGGSAKYLLVIEICMFFAWSTKAWFIYEHISYFFY